MGYQCSKTVMKVELAVILGLLGLGSAVVPPDALEKTFQKCDLASQLLAYGGAFTKSNIGDWICLTYYWCYASSPSSAQKYNDCNINCSNLLDDSITDDEKCATTIYNRHGFDAWYGWINNCKGKDNSDWVSDCNL